jgi:hypothetical protein
MHPPHFNRVQRKAQLCFSQRHRLSGWERQNNRFRTGRGIAANSDVRLDGKNINDRWTQIEAVSGQGLADRRGDGVEAPAICD